MSTIYLTCRAQVDINHGARIESLKTLVEISGGDLMTGTGDDIFQADFRTGPPLDEGELRPAIGIMTGSGQHWIAFLHENPELTGDPMVAANEVREALGVMSDDFTFDPVQRAADILRLEVIEILEAIDKITPPINSASEIYSKTSRVIDGFQRASLSGDDVQILTCKLARLEELIDQHGQSVIAEIQTNYYLREREESATDPDRQLNTLGKKQDPIAAILSGVTHDPDIPAYSLSLPDTTPPAYFRIGLSKEIIEQARAEVFAIFDRLELLTDQEQGSFAAMEKASAYDANAGLQNQAHIENAINAELAALDALEKKYNAGVIDALCKEYGGLDKADRLRHSAVILPFSEVARPLSDMSRPAKPAALALADSLTQKEQSGAYQTIQLVCCSLGGHRIREGGLITSSMRFVEEIGVEHLMFGDPENIIPTEFRVGQDDAPPEDALMIELTNGSYLIALARDNAHINFSAPAMRQALGLSPDIQPLDAAEGEYVIVQRLVFDILNRRSALIEKKIALYCEALDSFSGSSARFIFDRDASEAQRAACAEIDASMLANEQELQALDEKYAPGTVVEAKRDFEMSKPDDRKLSSRSQVDIGGEALQHLDQMAAQQLQQDIYAIMVRIQQLYEEFHEAFGVSHQGSTGGSPREFHTQWLATIGTKVQLERDKLRLLCREHGDVVIDKLIACYRVEMSLGNQEDGLDPDQARGDKAAAASASISGDGSSVSQDLTLATGPRLVSGDLGQEAARHSQANRGRPGWHLPTGPKIF